MGKPALRFRRGAADGRVVDVAGVPAAVVMVVVLLLTQDLMQTGAVAANKMAGAASWVGAVYSRHVALPTLGSLASGPSTGHRIHVALHARLGLRGGEDEEAVSEEAGERGGANAEAEEEGWESERESGEGDDAESGEGDSSAGKIASKNIAVQQSSILKEKTSFKTACSDVEAEEEVVFGIRKGMLGKSGGGWGMDVFRRLCWYFVDVLLLEAQRLRFVGHLLATAGVVSHDKVPPRWKRRRGRWWRDDAADAQVKSQKGSGGKESEKNIAKADCADGGGEGDDGGDDGAGVAEFLWKGVVGTLKAGEEVGQSAFTARERKMLEKKEAALKEALIEEVEEEEEEETHRPKVLQQWPGRNIHIYAYYSQKSAP